MTDDEKVCPRCAETIKRAAVVCRYCGNEFGTVPPSVSRSETVDPPPNKLPNGVLIGGGAALLILFLVLIGQCSISQPSSVTKNFDANLIADMNAPADMNAIDINATADVTVPEVPASWSYDTSTDEIRGSKIYRASIDSENSVEFDAPYDGGSTLSMTVRKHPKYGQDVYFSISKGQFVCGVESCSGTINFGSGPETISLTEPDDYSSDTLFVSNGESVISRLQKAKKVIVELPFYQEGNRQFTFETKPSLVWLPKD